VPTEPISDVAETSAWAGEHTVTFRLADPGASLGALAMLHAHRRYPDAFDAVHPCLTELPGQASR
jgi:hypothetical protein